MTDRGILFSGPMVRALIAGRKTQTRRLATSTLAHAVPGDRFWVRETWRTLQKWDNLKPRHVMDDVDTVDYAADGYRRNPLWAWGKGRPSIFMPRWASRITLIVEEKRVEPLCSISDADAIAEGLIWRPALEAWAAVDQDSWPTFNIAVRSYAGLWNSLHTDPGERWDDNPDVVVLSFLVEPLNIDLIGACDD